MGNKKAPWNRSKSRYDRKIESRELKQRVLIVCEGAKTEPYYFKCFRVNRKIVEIEIKGLGKNTESLVKAAMELKAKESYDQVWCVFDRDSFTPRSFNSAFEIAKKHHIEIAYSNQAFELWYLLHFNYIDTATNRAEYRKLLTRYLGQKYEKNSETMYETLLSRQPDAIRNAQKLLATYTPSKPEKNNPSTTVHLLVIELNKLM